MLTKGDAIFLGLCSGIAKHYGFDLMLVRLVFLLLLFASFGLGLGLYLLASFIYPNSSESKDYKETKKLGGICLYFSKRYNIDLVTLRFVVAIAGLALPLISLIYLILIFCLPTEKN